LDLAYLQVSKKLKDIMVSTGERKAARFPPREPDFAT